MSKLFEIFGRAITIDTAELICQWLRCVGSVGEKAEQFRQEEFAEIVECLGNGKIDDAQDKLKFYLFENPESIEARMAAASICLCRNSLHRAIEQLQSVYFRQPANTMALYALGYCYERLGKEAEAIEFYQDCLKFKNYLQLPHHRLGAIYLKSGRIDRVIKEYQQLIVEHPEDITSMVLLGYLFLASNDYTAAEDMFSTAIISHPDNFSDCADADEQQLLAEGRYDEVLEQTQLLMEQVGQMPDLYLKMADVLSAAGRNTEAIVYYKGALAKQPDYLEASIKLGSFYLRQAQPSLGADMFNKAFEINEQIVDAYAGLGLAEHLTGKNQQGRSTLSLASSIQQNSTVLFTETARINFMLTGKKMGSEFVSDPGEIDVEQIIQAHRKQVEQFGDIADNFYKYGLLLMGTERTKECMEAFQRVIEINPTHYRARCKLAMCYFQQHRIDRAMETLNDNSEIDGDTLRLHYQTAILFCDRIRFNTAIENLKAVMHNNSSSAEAVVNINSVLENIGLLDRAKSNWARLTQTASLFGS